MDQHLSPVRDQQARSDLRSFAASRWVHLLTILLAALIVLALLLGGALVLAPTAQAHASARLATATHPISTSPPRVVLLASRIPASPRAIRASGTPYEIQLGQGAVVVQHAGAAATTAPAAPAARARPPARRAAADWSCPATIAGVVQTPIDVCKWAAQAFWTLVGVVVSSIAHGLDNLIQPLAQADVFFGTPHVLTDQNPAVMSLAWLMRLAALAALGTIVAVSGFNLMLRPHLGITYYEAREILPRICLGGVGITVAIWACGQLIDLSNVLCSAAVINSVLPVSLPDLSSFSGSTDPALDTLLLAFSVLGYTIYALLVMIQIVIRLATLDVLLVLAPLAMACWILPQTQRWAERWTTLFVSILIIQPIQLLTISVGLGVATHLTTVAGSLFGTLALDVLEALICLGTYYVACKVPRFMTQLALGSSTLGAALSAAVVGGGLLRTALTVASLAGGGGGGGAAAAAAAPATGGGGGGGPGGGGSAAG